MRHLVWVLAGAATLLAQTAAAETTYTTVRLDNNPDFTIDVPAVVADKYKPTKAEASKSELMFFAVTTDDSGDLDCLLSGNRYSKELPRKMAISKLASTVRDVLCTSGREDASVGESEALTSNGYPSGRCAASYTKTGEKDPGRVESVLAVAAPHRFYLLTCTLRSSSEDFAKTDWITGWSDEVKHIQQSLHLPPVAK